MISPRKLMHYFKPVEEKITGVGKSKQISNFEKEFVSIVNTFDKVNALWYPSAGNDLKDIALFFVKKANTSEFRKLKPGIFIHTDFNYDENFEMNVGDNFVINISNENVSLEITEATTLYLEETPNCNPDYVGGRNSEMDGMARLVKFEVKNSRKSEFTYMLYIYIENIEFFKEYIVSKDLQIEHLVTIREGSGLGGGGKVTNKLFAYYLGLMECKYWYTDLVGRNTNTLSHLNESDDLLEKAYKDPFNLPVVLTGIKELKWSEYGNFLGDANIYKVDTLSFVNQNPSYTRPMIRGLWETAFFSKNELIGITKCGCFNCLKYFKPNEIMFGSENSRIPQCPFCSVDSVLRDTPQHPLNDNLLKMMNHFYFKRF